MRYQSASVQEYLGSLLNIYTWNAMCTFWKFYFEIQKEETPGGSRTRRQLLLLPLAWLINLCWSVQSVTSRRAIPAQDLRSASGNLLFFNLTFYFLTWLTSFGKAGDPLKFTSLPHRDAQHLWITFLVPARAQSSQGTLRVDFLPHGTQHRSDLSPSENAELNQHGVDLEILCLQHAGVTSIKHWKKCRHWEKNTECGNTCLLLVSAT